MPKISYYNTVYFFFEIYAPEIYEVFVYKHRETIECVKKYPIFLKNTNFTGK